MKQSICRKLKRSVSAILAASMSLSLFTGIPVSADVGKRTYSYDGYSVDYNVTNEWDGAQTVELTVSNTGTDSILNWALKYDAEGEITNLWNADMYEQNGDEYVIKNTGWNFEIAPNQSVTYGYTLNGSDISLPEKFEIYSKRVDKTEGYGVQYNITKSWDTGVEGNIVITNTSDAPIEAWTLSFDSNFSVDNLWNGRVLENNGTSYTVAAEMWTNPVQPDSSMTIGFVGSKAADVEAALSNFRLTEVVIGEGTPVVPVDPPEENIEITANATYDEENGNITVSWTSNKQDGTFDILMSADGENFSSVGTVENAFEYVYALENDFEKLYFKVVQTDGDKSAESNVVSVVNNKTTEDIIITASGSYDEKSGDITVSWETNTNNGYFEIFMSEDGENFTSIGTVTDVSEYVYDPATDFEEIYFKVIQTAGDRLAESNVVTVKSNIVLSVITFANYDEESGNIKVSWITSFDKGTYEIFVSEDNEEFTSLGVVENAKEYTYTPEGEFTVLYFKVKQTVGDLAAESQSVDVYYPIDWEDETDTDNDGLTDVYEKHYFETDPEKADTDGDGLPDGYEAVTLVTDPKKVDSDGNGVNDGEEDPDSDGLTNLREYELGTDPSRADSDNDGLTDIEEVDTYGTDPIKFDTDDDGISDSDEVALGLDPKNASTDGTPDSERIFVQHVGADSEAFSNINTEENPFKVSIDITAAGVAANNLYAKKSSYSNAIKNDAIVGISPEFTYAYGLKVEDVVVNFDLDSSVTANTNGKYTSVSDEFVGIKRLNVFKFFEDTNMLLPIETFHDVENNRVYTHTDELGTYCLMDMEIWLESLGITAEDMLSETAPAMFSMRSRVAAPVALNSDNEEEKQEYLDVVLAVYPNQIFINEVKEELKYVCKKIFQEAESDGKKARIYFVSIYAESVQTNTEGKLYAENYSEALYAINRQDIITLDLNERSYRLALAMNYIANNGKLNDLFDEATEKYCFVIDVCSYPEADAALRAPEVLKEKGFKVGFSYNKGNTNEQKYIKFSSNGMCEPAKTESNRYNFGDFVFNCIFGDISETQLIISSAGLRPIKLKTTLQQNYEAFKKSGDDVEYSASMDTDLDRLADYEEIMFSDINDNMLIDDSVPDNVRLFTFKETQNRIGKKPGYVISGTKHFYALNGLKRYKQETGEEGDCPKSLEDVLILPIRSDPTSKDGDNDKVVDGVDLKPLSYIPNFENTNLDSDTIAWCYEIRSEIIPSVDEHGNEINGENKENTVTKYFYDEYVAPKRFNVDYSDWLRETYGESKAEIYFQKVYDQVILGNAYEGEVTILGTAGEIIVGFTPFGIVCDIRNLTVDIDQFDSDKGLNQGVGWYLQTIPDFLSIVPVIGDIAKGTEDILPLLSKTDASKIVNTALEEATDSSGSIIKNTDDIVQEIRGEAEAVASAFDYNKADEIIDTAGKTGSDASAKIVKAAVDSSELIGKDGKFLDEVLEKKYLAYVKRKENSGKTTFIRERLGWKEQVDYFLGDGNIQRGNEFNRKAWNELNDKSTSYCHEVHLANGKRLDTYLPPLNGNPGKIISRKATNLEDIDIKTFEKYLSEFKNKYAVGTAINSRKYDYKLKGKVLEGDYYLEIPSSNRCFPEIKKYEQLAKDKGITIIYRDL